MQIFTPHFKISLTAFAAACLMAPALAGADPSLVNGSLEQMTNHGKTGDGAMDFSVYPDNWNLLVGGGESWANFGYSGRTPSPDGGNYWGTQYLTGDMWNGVARYAAGGISQTVTGLTVGQTYQISFYSMATHTPDPNVTAYWQVSFGDSTLNGTGVTVGTPVTWTQDKLNFVASSTSQTLQFAAVFLGATPGATPEILNIDGISISAVPEPSTWGLMLAGATALGLCVRRRRSS